LTDAHLNLKLQNATCGITPDLEKLVKTCLQLHMSHWSWQKVRII